eukprot:CAMPEP_0172312276 /NCGR_PEP_ID=MMETSP1058-20130122/17104_1 /TAXON_ID=83371 /ORGANISM="Detonula confervacea, Strain CCMP 353" /LENGTH=401 /DNA_ID=CAMNT_0013025687 /DNA_START=9 /DNA_END=1214 /DNA_ORIENTATION=+
MTSTTMPFLFRRHAMIAITIVIAIASLCTNAAASPSHLKGVGGSFRFPWQTKSASTPTSSSSSSLSTSPRGGAAARTRPVHKGSAASSSPVKKGPMKKKMKKRGARKMSGISQLPEGSRSSTKRSSSTGAAAAVEGDTMPSIFRIPSEEKYDRYAAALAVTEGLRRVRDAEIARAEDSKTKKSWMGSISSGDKDNSKAKGKSTQDQLEEAKKRAESAFLLLSTKAVKSLGMSVTQFNQIGREVTSDPALKERVSEQAYLYRMASAVNLEKVPLLEDPSSKKLLQSTEHKKFRVQLFARSVHEIEDLRTDQMEALRQSLQMERFPPGFDLSDPNVQPLLHPEVRKVCEKFPLQAEEIVKRYGLDSDEFNRMLEETKGNPIFRWRVQKYVDKAEEEMAKENKA